MIIRNDTYSVYIHHFPNGKMYVGITRKKPEARWGKDGQGYERQIVMRKAIQKYGWDNIEHEIFASHLTKDEACNMEKLLIQNLHLTDRTYGYNTQPGGLINFDFLNIEDTVMELWYQGLDIETIAVKCGCSINSVRVWLIANHVLDGDIDESSRQGKQFYRLQQEKTKYIDHQMISILGWEDGLSVGEIAVRGNIDRHIVARALRNYGITARERRERLYEKERMPHYKNRVEKRTLQYSKQGELIAEYYSAGEASRATGISYSTLCQACRLPNRTAGGYVWKYADDSA